MPALAWGGEGEPGLGDRGSILGGGLEEKMGHPFRGLQCSSRRMGSMNRLGGRNKMEAIDYGGPECRAVGDCRTHGLRGMGWM